MTEKDILYEVNGFWVSREKMGYMVWKPSASWTHSASDSAYPLTAEGFSLAKTRTDYLAKRAADAATALFAR